jgi:hypothetical protein
MTTIYSLNGHTITEGLPSSIASDEAFKTARRIARENQQSVVVEDEQARACYRVTLSGKRWRAPKGWRPWWDCGE